MSSIHYQAGMPTSVRIDPDASEYLGACGARLPGEYEESTSTWDKWYKAAGVEVPVLAPGQEIEFHALIVADHGGQSWLQVACADHIEEGLQWTLLERAQGDRNHHYMPSSPHIYAWSQMGIPNAFPKARFVVPEDYSCPGGRGVGRYVWKTGNLCTDSKNLGVHSTEEFSRDEFCAIEPMCPPECHVGQSVPGGGGAVETFMSCFDFTTGSGPTPPAPIPVPSPPAPTPVPTPPAPTPNPAVPVCCFVAYGDEATCQNYPGPVGSGLCNIDWSQQCITAADCEHASITV